MCMIGQLQWAVTLGRNDILAHVCVQIQIGTQNWMFRKIEQRPNTLPSGIEQKNLITLTFPNKNMIG